MEKDIPENLRVQDMETGKKICLPSAIPQAQIEPFFHNQSCCGSRSSLTRQNSETINRLRISQIGLPQNNCILELEFHKIASFIFSDKMTNEQL